jgi:hypothetical protein
LLRDPADVWSALDNRIRPSINVVVTLPMDDTDPITAPMVLTRRLRFNETSRWNELIQIAGQVTAEDGAPAADTVVRVRGRAFSTVASAEGRFAISGLEAGTYTLIAESDVGTAERQIEVPGSDYNIALKRGQAPAEVPAKPERAPRGAKRATER